MQLSGTGQSYGNRLSYVFHLSLLASRGIEDLPEYGRRKNIHHVYHVFSLLTYFFFPDFPERSANIQNKNELVKPLSEWSACRFATG
jgi:hypothetical protein